MIQKISEGGILVKNRLLGRIEAGPAASATRPTVTFFAGMHGNEPSGVYALQRVLEGLRSLQEHMTGDVICLAGNLPALESNQRFIWHDLNRIWTHENVNRARRDDTVFDGNSIELTQQREMLGFIDPILNSPPGPLYFIDLHTTSAPSVPFIVLNDQLANRRFALKFRLPAVLGLEEHLVGPLLSYLNESGHVSIAFEAGQHTDVRSIDCHESFCWLTLVHAGVLSAERVPNYQQHVDRLQAAAKELHGMFEVIYRHPVEPEDQFRMEPGFENFQPVRKGQVIAHDRHGEVRVPRRGRIFMPLYQTIGSDGFFVVRRIPWWALYLSAFLRRINFESVLVLLPGVSRSPDQPDTLIVNRRIARFLANEIFHLLGYRRKKVDGDIMIFSRREIQH